MLISRLIEPNTPQRGDDDEVGPGTSLWAAVQEDAIPALPGFWSLETGSGAAMSVWTRGAGGAGRLVSGALLAAARILRI